MGKNYDPYLQKYLREYQENPRSRVFAPLAEAYRKSGLVDEAIEICREGLEYHPNFTSGMVAVARCYIDKGLYTAAIKELEKVVSEVPDNYLAQKLLAHSYNLTGDKNNSLKAYKTVLYLNPKDDEVIKTVKEMEKSTTAAEVEETGVEDDHVPSAPDDRAHNFNYINEVKIPEGIMDEPGLDFEEKNVRDVFRSVGSISPDDILTDISTMTMGSLLEGQGLKEKALEVYKKLYEKDPNQKPLRERIESLEKEMGITSMSDEELFNVESTDGLEIFSDEPHDEIKHAIEEQALAKSELIFKPDKDLLDEIYEDQPKTSTPDPVSKLESILERLNNYRLAH